MSEAWPWLLLIGLGAFHGLNPAMGWLFAVALGLHRQSRAVVLISLIPIAIGHAIAIALIVYAVTVLGAVIDQTALRMFSGLLLVAWGNYAMLSPHRHRSHIGFQTRLLGLGVWSFLMATVHGAGLSLIPGGDAARDGADGYVAATYARHAGVALIVDRHARRRRAHSGDADRHRRHSPHCL